MLAQRLGLDRESGIPELYCTLCAICSVSVERTGPPSAYTVSALDRARGCRRGLPSPSRAWPASITSPCRSAPRPDGRSRGSRHRHGRRAPPVDALREPIGLGALRPEQPEADLGEATSTPAGSAMTGLRDCVKRDLMLAVVVHEPRDRRNLNRDGLTVERRRLDVGDPERVEHALQLLGVALDAELVLAPTSIDVSVKPAAPRSAYASASQPPHSPRRASSTRRAAEGSRRRDLLADQRRQVDREARPQLRHSLRIERHAREVHDSEVVEERSAAVRTAGNVNATRAQTEAAVASQRHIGDRGSATPARRAR